MEQLIRHRMRERGVSFTQAVNDAIRASGSASAGSAPFRTATASLGESTVNLDRALAGGRRPRGRRTGTQDPVGTVNLINDAHLAALAIEHRCGIESFDADFSRFPGIRWQPPPD